MAKRNEPPPLISELSEDSLNVLRWRIIGVESIGDVWIDDHVACRAVRIKTEAGTVDVSLWWCGDVAYLVDVANESPRAMAAVLHVVYTELADAQLDKVREEG